MGRIARGLWAFVKFILAAIGAAALVEIFHECGWFPDRDLASLIVHPGFAASSLAYAIVVAIVAIPLLFAEHWLGPIIADRFRKLRGLTPSSPALSEEPSVPSLTVALEESPASINGFKPACALAIVNSPDTELKACLVQITEIDGHKPLNMQLPFTLRTREQITSREKGRFSLFKRQKSVVPVLFVNPHRVNEWFLVGESNQERYLVIAGPIKLGIAVYGGPEPVRAFLFIDTDAGWKPHPRLTFPPTVAQLAAQRISLPEAAAELYAQIANTKFGRLKRDECGGIEERIWDAMGSMIIYRGGGWGRRPGSDKYEKLDKGSLNHAIMIGGARIVQASSTRRETLFTDLETTRGELDRIINEIKALATES